MEGLLIGLNNNKLHHKGLHYFIPATIQMLNVRHRIVL